MQLKLQQFREILQCRVGEDRRIVKPPDHPDATLLERQTEIMQGRVPLLLQQLVRQHHPNLGAGFPKESQIQIYRVYDVADPATGNHQHRGIQTFRQPGIVQTDHRTDPGMPGTLDNQKITLFFQRGRRPADLFQIKLRIDLSIKNIASCLRLQHHRRHE